MPSPVRHARRRDHHDDPSQASSVHPLLPYEEQPGRLLLASGVRAGDWIFASGLLPTRFGSAARPLSGEPAWTTQFRSLWERAQAVLAAGGTDLTHTVRCDQFLPDWRAMPFFLRCAARSGRRIFRRALRCSMSAYCCPRQRSPCISSPGAGRASHHTAFSTMAGPAGHLILRAGHESRLLRLRPACWRPMGKVTWAVSRLRPRCPRPSVERPAHPARAGLSPPAEAWPALAAAGSSLARVVKADVAITDLREVPAFNQGVGPGVWRHGPSHDLCAHRPARPGHHRCAPRDHPGEVALCDDRQGRAACPCG